MNIEQTCYTAFGKDDHKRASDRSVRHWLLCHFRLLAPHFVVCKLCKDHCQSVDAVSLVIEL